MLCFIEFVNMLVVGRFALLCLTSSASSLPAEGGPYHDPVYVCTCSYSLYISGYFPYTFLAFIIPAMLLIVLCLLVLIAIMVSPVGELPQSAWRVCQKCRILMSEVCIVICH